MTIFEQELKLNPWPENYESTPEDTLLDELNEYLLSTGNPEVRQHLTTHKVCADFILNITDFMD